MPRVTMRDFEDWGWKVSSSYLSMGRTEGSQREGVYMHPECIFRVFEIYGNRPITSMFFILDGHSYHRRWETIWGDKTLARLAREFIEEVTSEQ
jgi:hypothetical protein